MLLGIQVSLWTEASVQRIPLLLFFFPYLIFFKIISNSFVLKATQAAKKSRLFALFSRSFSRLAQMPRGPMLVGILIAILYNLNNVVTIAKTRFLTHLHQHKLPDFKISLFFTTRTTVTDPTEYVFCQENPKASFCQFTPYSKDQEHPVQFEKFLMFATDCWPVSQAGLVFDNFGSNARSIPLISLE